MAYRDALTGVRSKLAYLDMLKDMEVRMHEGTLTEYGVMIFDLNGLKDVNDNQGHDMGDEYIRSACRLICRNYDHSPVFRIGGDEFAAILEGNDYENRETLMEDFLRSVEENQRDGRVVIACGMAVYDPKKDTSYNDVFRRADRHMYECKERLKLVG
jgi:diguanylate cyclase (GGDEF)-like protein